MSSISTSSHGCTNVEGTKTPPSTPIHGPPIHMTGTLTYMGKKRSVVVVAWNEHGFKWRKPKRLRRPIHRQMEWTDDIQIQMNDQHMILTSTHYTLICPLDRLAIQKIRVFITQKFPCHPFNQEFKQIKSRPRRLSDCFLDVTILERQQTCLMDAQKTTQIMLDTIHCEVEGERKTLLSADALHRAHELQQRIDEFTTKLKHVRERITTFKTGKDSLASDCHALQDKILKQKQRYQKMQEDAWQNYQKTLLNKKHRECVRHRDTSEQYISVLRHLTSLYQDIDIFMIEYDLKRVR